MDGHVMEQFTSHPHIVNMYGACGPNGITAMGNSARTFLKTKLSERQRLQHAIDIVDALDSLHQASITHNDINIANLIEINGSLVFHDFNLAESPICELIPSKFANPFWKSPEEIFDVLIDPYASDVYGIANVLFSILTKRQPWTHLEIQKLNKTQVQELKRQHKAPFLPSKFQNTVLAEAIRRCFRPAKDRPTASELLKFLQRGLKVTKW